MRRHYFIKEGASPIWIHVPGTPFTLPGERTQYSRLPGMTEWAPRDVVERMGRGLAEDKSVKSLVEQEKQQGLLSHLVRGSGGGLVGGAIGGRLMGGEAATNPFKQIFKKGLNLKTLKGLSKLPRSAKLLPLLGLGAGAAGGVGMWSQGQDARKREAQEVAKGLLSEQILQQHSIGQARRGLENRSQHLAKLPADSAFENSPKAVVLGNTGV